jgi:hypothetical protein
MSDLTTLEGWGSALLQAAIGQKDHQAVDSETRPAGASQTSIERMMVGGKRIWLAMIQLN